MNIFIYLKSIIRLNYAIDKADRAHEKTGERYYVLPDHNNKLIILDRYHFRKLKKKGRLTYKANIFDMQRECFYCTAYKNGEGALNQKIIKVKRKMYLEYVQAMRDIRQAKKKIKK